MTKKRKADKERQDVPPQNRIAVKAKEAEKRAEPNRKKQEKREGSVAERIASLEKRGLAIDEEMCREEIFSDGEAMRRLTAEKASLTAELETLYAEWMSAAGGENA